MKYGGCRKAAALYIKMEGEEMKVTIDASSGKQEQVELTEQEQKEIMEKEGHTQPKKAWLLRLAPVKLYRDAVIIKTGMLKRFVEMQGYEVIGETEVSRRGKAVEKTIEKLLKTEPPVNGADVLYIKGMKLITLDGYKKALELYDKVTAKGIEFLSADGILERIRDDYDFHKKIFQEIDEFDLEKKLEEQNDDELTQTM